ncbi:MAG: response regulator [Deltaproteobacteria bacterium]|nr:response regulator [Deltaproteobacteria bacterium]
MSKKRILLVEDDKTIRILLASALEYDGYQVDAAENGVQAVYYLEDASYDLIITDYMMPEMDGLELTRKIKDKYPFMPVIAITGTDAAYDILKAEATVCIKKPFDLYALKEQIEEIFKGRISTP